MTPEGKLTTGDWISFTRSVIAWGEVWPRGASVQLTPELIEKSIDSMGRSWLDTVDNDGARIQRGQWPTTEPRWTHGDPEWAEQREAARRRAWAVQDPAERAAARDAVERDYGPAAVSSKTLNAAPDPSAQLAAEQRARLDAEGLRHVSRYAPERREA